MTPETVNFNYLLKNIFGNVVFVKNLQNILDLNVNIA